MKKLILGAALAAASIPAFAGGYVTNTNQSVSFLRMPAQEAVISVDAAYFNPAGVVFLGDGWYFGGNYQAAFQNRLTTTTFAPLAYGAANNGKGEKEYKGKTVAPFIPSLDLAYVHDRWALSAHVGVIGGGGSAVYDDGVGSFETPLAGYAAVFNALGGPILYGADIYVKGSSFYVGAQLNAAYKVTDNLSVALGLRGTYAIGSYDAYIHDITLNGAPAGAALTAMGYGTYAPLVADRDLDCSQKGMAWSPVIGIDYMLDKWNFALRYEFRGKLGMKNDTETNTTGIATYDDGRTVRSDIPSLLAIGVGYSVLPQLRLYGSFHRYGDKQAKTYNAATGADDKQELWGRNSYEGIFGVEYDLLDRLTLSTGVQYCTMDFGKNNAFISDMSFTTNSTSVGIGAKYAFSDKFALECAWFKSFFATIDQSSVVTAGTTDIPCKTEFTRTSQVLSLGCKLAF